MVEDQAQVATNRIVDDTAEQALLEELLDGSKPPPPAGTTGLHYLLYTPFRYPPLRHGSRFGTRQEPSLFYASQALSAALAETAYYRCLFWAGMSEPPPAAKLTSQHTLFAVNFRTDRGMSLIEPPFDRHAEQIESPTAYRHSQALGRAMREAGVEAFAYRSARDRDKGTNTALFTPAALSSRRPLMTQPWICETRASGVSLYNKTAGNHEFAVASFHVDGVLPMPAL